MGYVTALLHTSLLSSSLAYLFGGASGALLSGIAQQAVRAFTCLLEYISSCELLMSTHRGSSDLIAGLMVVGRRGASIRPDFFDT